MSNASMHQRIDEAIVSLHEKNFSYREIQEVLHVGPTRINAVLHKKPINHVKGRPKKLHQEIIDFVEENALKGGILSDADMVKMIQNEFNQKVSRSSVCRLRKQLNFVYRPPVLEQDLKVPAQNERNANNNNK